MQAKTAEARMRRVTVILGSSGSSRNLLDVVLPLLSGERAVEMQGVFLEEAEVQHAAELPFVQELCRVTFNVREFNNDQFERSLALRMRTARRALAVLARRTGVQHTFQNVRGSAIGLLQEALGRSDITVFEPLRMISASMSPPARLRLPRQRIVVAVDSLDTAPRNLTVADHLAEGRTQRVTVLLTPGAASDDSILEEVIGYRRRGRPGRIRTIPGNGLRALLDAVQSEGPAMLVLGADSTFMGPDALRLLRERLRCPVFLVRNWVEDRPSA